MNNPGDINKYDQQLLRMTVMRGTDPNSCIWILKCRRCLNIYGSSNTEACQRECPKCQGAKPGLDLPTERDGETWSREEHIIAFHLYNRIPFGRIHIRNPEVIELSGLLGRKVGSVSRKLANFSRLDPFHQARSVRGLEHGSKGEEEVWNEFLERPEALSYESAQLLAARLGCSIERVAEIDDSELPPPGKEREALVKLRVNQGFFRQRVLSVYDFRCCVTGLSCRPLLVASHIVPWSEDASNRLNPRNGLCLNALHDRAFDRGLMWIGLDYTIRISSRLRETTNVAQPAIDWLMGFDHKRLLLPEKFAPDPALLAVHASRWAE